MHTSNLKPILLSLVLLLSLGGVFTPVAADSPTVGRNFVFPVTSTDTIVVTLTEDLPVTAADSYFDIMIDGSIYDQGVGGDQRVYPLDLDNFPESTNPWEIRLGIYGTVSLNGVELNTIDGEVLAGIQAVDTAITGPDSNRFMTVGGYVFADPVIFDGLWVTVEYIPTGFTGMPQAEIDAVRSAFAAYRDAEIIYGNDAFDPHSLTLPCSTGSFSLSTMITLGPDHSFQGPGHVIQCDLVPEIRVTRGGTPTVIEDGGSFTFPTTSISFLPVSQMFNICNLGGASLNLSNPGSLVSGTGFIQAGTAPPAVLAAGTCTVFTVSFNATSAGNHNGAITINNSDLDENPYNISLGGTALPASNPQIHIQSQTVTRSGFLSVKASDQILVTDQNNQPVAGVQVTASYTGPSSGQVSGITNSSGRVTLQTGSVLRPKGQWCFTVTSLSKSGYTYNPAANVVTTRCG